MFESRVCPVCCGAAHPVCSMDLSFAGTNKPDTFANYPVHYEQCGSCGFAWCPEMWTWGPEEFHQRIYTPDYGRFDPGFGGPRAGNCAIFTHNLLWKSKLAGYTGPTSIVDYGGGDGWMTGYLKEMGWADVDFSDPFYGKADAKPADFVTSWEVFEHHPDPRQLVKDVMALVKPEGCVVFSTQLLTGPMDPTWWYIAPRSGHISFYTGPSLKLLFDEVGASVLSFDVGTHVAWVGPVPPAITCGFIRVEMPDAACGSVPTA